MRTTTRFAHKVAIVTGAGNGIGYQIARQLVQEGASVVLNDISAEATKAAVDRLCSAFPGRCVAVAGDAGDMQVIQQMVSQATYTFGRLDIAVANAGNTLFGDFFEIAEADFQKVVALNLKGSFFLAQQAARQMRAQGGGGRLLLMSSTIGMRAYPHLSVYAMTKAALHMMAKNLVLDLSPLGITINAIAPGATLTERTAVEDADYENTWSALIPKGKTAMPEDIANAALFLLSEEAAHITGQTLTVDGGWTCVAPYPAGQAIKR